MARIVNATDVKLCRQNRLCLLNRIIVDERHEPNRRNITLEIEDVRELLLNTHRFISVLGGQSMQCNEHYVHKALERSITQFAESNQENFVNLSRMRHFQLQTLANTIITKTYLIDRLPTLEVERAISERILQINYKLRQLLYEETSPANVFDVQAD